MPVEPGQDDTDTVAGRHGVPGLQHDVAFVLRPNPEQLEERLLRRLVRQGLVSV